MTTPEHNTLRCSVEVATFNTEWRKPHTADANLIRERLGDAEVICLTEAYRGVNRH